jgi:hypothetical protein
VQPWCSVDDASQDGYDVASKTVHRTCLTSSPDVAATSLGVAVATPQQLARAHVHSRSILSQAALHCEFHSGIGYMYRDVRSCNYGVARQLGEFGRMEMRWRMQ